MAKKACDPAQPLPIFTSAMKPIKPSLPLKLALTIPPQGISITLADKNDKLIGTLTLRNERILFKKPHIRKCTSSMSWEMFSQLMSLDINQEKKDQ